MFKTTAFKCLGIKFFFNCLHVSIITIFQLKLIKANIVVPKQVRLLKIKRSSATSLNYLGDPVSR